MSNLLCSIRAFERKMSGKRIFQMKELSKKEKTKIADEMEIVSKAFRDGSYVPKSGIDFGNLKKLGFNDQGTFLSLWQKYTKQPDFDPATFPVTIKDIRKFKIGVNAWNKRIGRPRTDFAKRWYLPKDTLRDITKLATFEKDLKNQSSFFRRYNVKMNKAINDLLVDFQDVAGSLEPNIFRKGATKLGLVSRGKDLANLQGEWQSLFQQMAVTSDPNKLSRLKSEMKQVDGQIVKLFENNGGRAFELINQLFQGVDPESMHVEVNGVKKPLNPTQKSKMKNMARLNQVIREESAVTLVRGLEKVAAMAKDKNIAWAQEYVDRIKGYIKQIEFQAVIDKQGKTIDQKFWTKEKTLFKLGFEPQEFLMTGTVGKDAKMAFSPHYMTQFTMELLKPIRRLEESIEAKDITIDKKLKLEIESWDNIISEIKGKDVTLNRIYSKDPYFFLKKYVNDVGIFNYKTHLKSSFNKAANDLYDFHLKPAKASGNKRLEDSATDMMKILDEVYSEITLRDPTKDRFSQDIMRAMTSYTYFRLMGGNLRSAVRNGGQRFYELTQFGMNAVRQARSWYSTRSGATENTTLLKKWLQHYGLQWSDGNVVKGGILDGFTNMFSRKKTKSFTDDQLSQQSRGALQDAYTGDGTLYVNSKGELTILGGRSAAGFVADKASSVAKKTGFAHRVVEDWNRASTFKIAFSLAFQNLQSTPDSYLSRKVIGWDKVQEIKARKGKDYEVTIEDLREIHGVKTREKINEYIEATAAQTAYNATMDLHFEYAKWNKARAINPKDTDKGITKFVKAGLGQFSHYKFSMASLMYKWARDAGISMLARDFRSEEVIRMMRFGMVQMLISGMSVVTRTNLSKLFSNDVLRDAEIATTWLEMNRQQLFSEDGPSDEIKEKFMDVTFDQGLGYFAGPNYQIGKSMADKIFTAFDLGEITEFMGAHENPIKMQIFGKGVDEAVKTDKNQKIYEKWYGINSMIARNMAYGGQMFTEGGGLIDWARLELGLFPSKEQRKASNLFYETLGFRDPKVKKGKRRSRIRKDMDKFDRRRAIKALSNF